MTQKRQRRPKTYSRAFNATAESRRAVGKFHDDATGKIKTCRFSIGTGADAERRLAAIQQLFETGGGDYNGLWYPGLLKAAKQIAAGETPSLWLEEADSKDYAQNVLGSRTLIPALNLIPHDPQLMAQSVAANKAYIEAEFAALRKKLESEFATQASAMNIPKSISVTRLHDALRAYQTQRVANYKGKFQGAVRVRKQLDDMLAVAPDCWLHEFDHDALQNIADHYAKRPATKVSRIASKAYCGNQITELFKFCRWMKRLYDWDCPDLSAIDRRVLNKASDKLRNSIEVDKHWEPHELQAIFQNAEPLTKLIIAVGLNTGSGAAELGRMRVEHFLLDQPHPHARLIKFNEKASWFIGIRQKQFSHSEALLWPWVASLVKQQIKTCKENGWPFLFTDNGEPLYRDNDMYEELGLPNPDSSKPESRFGTRYRNAVNRAFKKKLITRKLSLGKLRKTLSNYLASVEHEDLASLLLSHGTQDDQLANYANRPYRRMHEAIAKTEEYWNLEKKSP